MALRERMCDYSSTGPPPPILDTGAALAIGASWPHHQHGAMNPNSPHDWRPLYLGRDARFLGSDGRPVQRLVGSGHAVRLRRGVAVDATGRDTISDRDRYFLRMRAVEATRKSQPVYSHESAAVLWGLPLLGRWPDEGHLRTARLRSGSTATSCLIDPTPTDQRVGHEPLGSPLSSATIDPVRWASPSAGDRFTCADSRALMNGRTSEEVVWSEKLHEDRLRGTGHGMERWIWAEALRRESLKRLLLAAGLRPNQGNTPTGEATVAVPADHRR